MTPIFNGVITRFNGCESTYPRAKDCPHTNKSVNMTENNNPNLPSNIINGPPALEDKTIGEVMKRHLTCFQEARKAYLATESERIQRTLRKQIRPKGEE